MHTTRKFKSLKVQGKDFMVVVLPLVGMFKVARNPQGVSVSFVSVDHNPVDPFEIL